MKILILGMDGYLGWPTAMDLAARGHEVLGIDNYLRRNMALETCSEPLIPTPNLHDKSTLFETLSQNRIAVEIGDCTDYDFFSSVFKDFLPDAVVHYAEQPSAPYSMRSRNSAALTLNNNLQSTFNLIWNVIEHQPNCHIVKLGTMGEYGTPNIDIEEGWIEINHNGRSHEFLYPRQAASLYHTTKILDTDLLWFYVRTAKIRVTDLMQGPVYGLETEQTILDDQLLPNFHYDDIFGTLINRFIVQAISNTPLTVYGEGGQTRGYLNLKDTLQCIDLALNTPPAEGELRILNQFTELFSVNQIAEKIQVVGKQLGLDVKVQNINNPRIELENHYYNAKHHGLLDLGLQPHLLTDDALATMMNKIIQYQEKIDTTKILPRVCWNNR